ncbi:protein lifeguard 2-like [Physella acuta]|uniref:protein lifeguard 2-like n=1 Tax=Physella acuta TaxID=109671 RepID=UPI0027DE869D|nr:protein lifeguard 2-like [Physella acuta]XP_059172603.1 protein lifeguard 2-like [Physella acuta]XP_059172604.1 protein lifeguard 2-like [Physella acuta]
MSNQPPSYGMAMGYPTGPNKNEGPGASYPPAGAAYPSANATYPQQPGIGFAQHDPYNQGYNQPMYNDGFNQPAAYNHPDGSGEAALAVPKASDGFSSAFSDKAIRRGFIRKVYLILFTQLLVTFGFICLFIFVEPIKKWVQNNMWFYICAYVLFLVLYFVLICCPSVRKNYPGNFICLGLFTLAFSYLTATISSFHDTGIVLMAAGITAAVCLAISLFAIQTKIDFTMCSGLLFALVMVLFFFGWACLITYYAWGYSHIMNCVYGGLAALVFGLFLIYDTQQVMGGRKYELSAEEYIYGALQLYIDIVYIFIIILGFMGNSK